MPYSSNSFGRLQSFRPLFRIQLARTKLVNGLSVLLAILAASALTACGPYLSTSMDVPEIPLSTAATNGQEGARASLSDIDQVRPSAMSARSVAVERFVDIRHSPAIVTRGEDTTELVGDVGVKISDAVRRELVQKGFNVSSFGENAVRGQVKAWRADVDSNLNGSLNSEAALLVEVFNRREQKVFSGIFRGSAKSQTPLISSSDVSDSLGKAMAQAIDQLLNDHDFMQAITN